jgi:pimeloyl-ACP methyl ester carboxylesterase
MAETVQELDLEVEGRTWHYYVAGDEEAPPMLLVHGYHSSARFFRPAMEALSQRWRVVAPDLPGHGDSQPWDPEEDVVEQWVMLVGFLEALGLRRMAVFGSSRGGAVALQMAAHRPEVVTSLAVIAAPIHPFTPGTLDIRKMLVNPDVLSPELLKALGTTMMAAQGYEKARRRAVEADELERDLRPILGKVRAPVLVVWGAEDRTIPVEMGLQLLRDLPDARFELVGGAGHVPLLDRPEEMLAILIEFFGEHDPFSV